jgi:hypothetical protein
MRVIYVVLRSCEEMLIALLQRILHVSEPAFVIARSGSIGIVKLLLCLMRRCLDPGNQSCKKTTTKEKCGVKNLGQLNARRQDTSWI